MKRIPDIRPLVAAGKRSLRKLALIFAFLAAVSGLTLFLRGPQVSRYLERLVFTAFNSATGYRMTAGRLYANLFPLYAGADDLKVTDRKGGTVFTARTVKAYVALAPLLQKTILIKRIVLVRPGMWATDGRINHLESLAWLKNKRPPGENLRLKVDSVVLDDAALNYTGGKKDKNSPGHSPFSAVCRGVNGEVRLGPGQEVRVSAREIGLEGDGIPRLSLKLDSARVMVEKGVLGIRDLTVESGGSRVRFEGSYSRARGARADAKIGLLASTLKHIFRLKGPGKGKLSIEGKAIVPGKFSDWKKTYIDMDVNGGLYAQSLMELLRLKVRVAGLANVKGRVKGPLDSLDGSGSGSLEKADIYGAQAGRLAFNVGFHHGVLSFNKIAGTMYGGRAKGDFSITIPVVRSMDMDLAFHGMDSRRFLAGFLKTSLPLPEGRLSGRMMNRGPVFAPTGAFRFLARRLGRDFPGRIGSVTSGFALAGTVASFPGMVIKTGATVIKGSGDINYAKMTADMALSLRTDDFRDLTLPYSTIVQGAGGFDGRVYGPIEDPVITGRLFSGNAVFHGMEVGAVEGDISYNKNALEVRELRAQKGGETVSVSGSMLFPEARRIFELGKPVYGLDISLAGGDAQDVAKNYIKPGLPVSGYITGAKLKLLGRGPEISGSLKARDVVYSGASMDSADMDFAYWAGGERKNRENGKLVISRAVLARGGASVKLTGALLPGGAFNFKASSEGVDIRKVLAVKGQKQKQKLPVDYKVSFQADGEGTAEDPSIEVRGRLSEGVFKNSHIGGGAFSVNISRGSAGRKASFHLALQGGKMDLKGQALLEGAIPWKARVVLKNGEYNFLVASMFKTVPPDLVLNLQGSGSFSGQWRGTGGEKIKTATKTKSLNGSFDLNQLGFTAFGRSFSTRGPARLDIHDGGVTLRRFSLYGERTDVGLSGSVVLGKSYDVSVSGKSSLIPFKGFSKQLTLLTGQAHYVFHIGGNWKSPRVSGGLSLSDAALGLRGVPQNLRITSAYMYVDENKIVLQQLSARTGGGDVNVTGVIYLKGLRPDRFYLDSAVNNVSVSGGGFEATFDGGLEVNGNARSRTVAGEIFVKKAVYTKNVDWNAFVLRKRAILPPSPTGFQATTGLNIRVYGSALLVKNNLVHAPLNEDITIRGTLAHPIPLGRVQASGGDVYFRNTEFTIEHASVIFSDPNRINPSMEVVASTTIQGYRIDINAAGTLDHITLSFSSQPQLEQTDILSLLTTGNFGSSASPGVEGGVDASEASSFLAGQFEDVITSRLKSITGFDRLQIDPYVSTTTGMVTPRITVSKRLLGDKLFVIYSAPIGTKEQIIRLEYAVTPSVSIIGSRDDTGDMGGDIKYQFRFR